MEGRYDTFFQFSLGEISFARTRKTGGNINFSFLSGYDIASEISPGEIMVLQFLKAGSINNFAS